MRESRIEFRVSRSGFLLALFAAAAFLLGTFSVGFVGAAQVWEKMEITLYAEESYENPYKEVDVWVDLKQACPVCCREANTKPCGSTRGLVIGRVQVF